MLERAGSEAGLVTIVTPLLDGAAFLSKTIDSVLAQTYPHIEYIVVDGGSSDSSLAIAEGYGKRVKAITIPASTQAEATNAGFAASHGEFFTFLGADDLLEPTAIAEMVASLAANPTVPYVYAEANFIDEDDRAIGRYPTQAFDVTTLAEACYVCQPSTLLRSDVYAAVDGLDERFHAAFDYDLWIRLAQSRPAPIYLERVLVGARMHYKTKSYLSRRGNFPEICSIVRSHYHRVPFSWIHTWAGIAITNGDTFFDPPRGSLARTALTFALGLAYNLRDPVAFVREYGREIVRLRREKRTKPAA